MASAAAAFASATAGMSHSGVRPTSTVSIVALISQPTVSSLTPSASSFAACPPRSPRRDFPSPETRTARSRVLAASPTTPRTMLGRLLIPRLPAPTATSPPLGNLFEGEVVHRGGRGSPRPRRRGSGQSPTSGGWFPSSEGAGRDTPRGQSPRGPGTRRTGSVWTYVGGGVQVNKCLVTDVRETGTTGSSAGYCPAERVTTLSGPSVPGRVDELDGMARLR